MSSIEINLFKISSSFFSGTRLKASEKITDYPKCYHEQKTAFKKTLGYHVHNYTIFANRTALLRNSPQKVMNFNSVHSYFNHVKLRGSEHFKRQRNGRKM